MKASPSNDLTVPESITTIFNGKTVTGTLWLHPSRRGRFEVEYNGMRKTDNRTDYTDEGHIRGIAKLILQEMVEE